MNFDCTLIILF